MSAFDPMYGLLFGLGRRPTYVARLEESVYGHSSAGYASRLLGCVIQDVLLGRGDV
jgi:hypothetical protein